MRAPTVPTVTALAILALVALGCSTRSDLVQEAEAYRRSGNLFLAYSLLERARDLDPGDERIEAAYWTARLEYLIDRGRELVFKEDMLQAASCLEAALALDPQSESAKGWLGKAKQKLAKQAVRAAEDARATGRLDDAFASYNRALECVPGLAEAEEGLAKLRLDYARKQEQARLEYKEGVRTQAEQRFEQTGYHMSEALLNDPTLTAAKERKDSVDLRLAERRYLDAKKLEETSRYGAALVEYQAVAKEAPGLAGVDERIEQMKQEVEAARLMREGEDLSFRGEFADARVRLDKAYELSKAERKRIGELLVAMKEREQDSRYQQAKDLELEHRFEDAVKGFSEIDQTWPGFRDVKARISGLEAAIEIATKAKARGEAAETSGDRKAALEAYQEALLAYPGFGGLDKRVKELREKS